MSRIWFTVGFLVLLNVHSQVFHWGWIFYLCDPPRIFNGPSRANSRSSAGRLPLRLGRQVGLRFLCRPAESRRGYAVDGDLSGVGGGSVFASRTCVAAGWNSRDAFERAVGLIQRDRAEAFRRGNLLENRPDRFIRDRDDLRPGLPHL